MIPVKGHKNLFRDPSSGAIITMDSEAYKRRLERKNILQKKDERINRLEQEVEELKQLVEKLIGK